MVSLIGCISRHIHGPLAVDGKTENGKRERGARGRDARFRPLLGRSDRHALVKMLALLREVPWTLTVSESPAPIAFENGPKVSGFTWLVVVSV